MPLRDVGWVWEGQGLDPGVAPSIFGVGEGARYLGLTRACFMFHPNSELALEKMRGLDEVVCDITKWQFREVKDGAGRIAFENFVSGDPALTLAEAEKVSRLARDFPNVTGAIIDDLSNLINNHGYTPERHAEVRQALQRHDDTLRLWAVVYTHELDPDYWRPYLPGIDVANLWVWNAGNLPQLDDYMRRCREVFPGKPIVLGAYLRDYAARSPVPLEMLQLQFERIARYVERGDLEGFSILGACLIDTQPEQAAWVREFIAAR
jgi:hypothetical protein